MDSRQQFEESPRFKGMDFTRSVTHPEHYESPYANGAWDGWQSARELLVVDLPEITESNIDFALNCHMEDPTDDEEAGFYAGVSWCIAFIKIEIGKRSRK